VLGLNPHSGESGLIGKEEKSILIPTLRTIKDGSVVGPLVPDAAFRKENFSKFSVFVALYHDQGLIPFKLVHGGNGAHVTLGLPFVRTSVDHGTAKDIFGKNVAESTSMEHAIRLAAEMVQSL
jgi:4-hydroxy-L-threonine phosphate dehydrogenase PdxA